MLNRFNQISRTKWFHQLRRAACFERLPPGVFVRGPVMNITGSVTPERVNRRLSSIPQ